MRNTNEGKFISWTCYRVIAFFLLLLFAPKAHARQWSLGVSGGLSQLQSPGIETINQRLGHSIRLAIPEKHGLVDMYKGSYTISDKYQIWLMEFGFSSFYDQLEGESIFQEDIHLTSSLQGTSAYFQMGIRAHPYTRGLFRANHHSMWERLHCYLFAGIGSMHYQHRYSYRFAEQGTWIVYQMKAIHALASLSMRWSYILSSSLDLSTEIEYFHSVPMLSSHNVSSFTVRHQDLRYRLDELELDSFSKASLSGTNLLIGLRYITYFQ